MRRSNWWPARDFRSMMFRRRFLAPQRGPRFGQQAGEAFGVYPFLGVPFQAGHAILHTLWRKLQESRYLLLLVLRLLPAWVLRGSIPVWRSSTSILVQLSTQR